MDGRESQARPGTSEKFRSAWFVGFTPQLVTAVGMFQPCEDGSDAGQLTPFGGERNITGGSLPRPAIWGDIMSQSLEGQEMLEFPGEVTLDNETRERNTRRRPPPPTPGAGADRGAHAEEPTEEPTTESPARSRRPRSPTEEPSEEPSDEPSEEPSDEPTTESGNGGSESGQDSSEKPTTEDSDEEASAGGQESGDGGGIGDGAEGRGDEDAV